MKLNDLKWIICFLALIGLTSCAPSYHFKVDAIAGGAVQSSDSFYLTSNDAEKNATDINFEEASTYIKTVLEHKGFHNAQDLDSADTLIVVSYGIGDPQEVLVVRGSNSANSLLSPTYAIRREYDDSGGVVGDGTSTYLVEVPSQGSEPAQDRLERKTVYEKYLKLEAFDNRLAAPSHERERLWSIGIANADQSEDIQEYLPYMLAAALPYIAKETGSQISVELKPNDPTIEFIRSSKAIDRNH